MAANAADKVTLRLKSVAGAPQVAQERVKVTPQQKFSEISQYLRGKCQGKPVLLFLNAAFSPSPEETVGALHKAYKDSKGELVVQSQAQAEPSQLQAFQQQQQQSSGATRYFLLKSVSIDNIEKSVAEGVWATQKHNEEKLNKAFETSEAVHLIFSVNSSGFFQGWARMTSRISLGQRDRRDWEGRLAVGSSFEVEWQRRYDLVMRSCDHLINPWNENKPVRIARDGQEMPASIGKQLVDAIEQAAVADHVIKPPKPKRRPPPEPPRRPPSGMNNAPRRPPVPMGMGHMGQGPMMAMPPPFGMMPPSHRPPMYGADFNNPMGAFPPGRPHGPMGMGPPMQMAGDYDRLPSPGRLPGGGPPRPPPRPPRDSLRENGGLGGSAGRGSDWGRVPDLVGDNLNGFDDDQPFEDQAPRRGRGLGDGPRPQGLLMGARDGGVPHDILGGMSGMAGQQPGNRRQASSGLQEFPTLRAKRERSASRSPSPRRRSRSRRRTRSRSDSRSRSPGDKNNLLNLTYEEYLENFKKMREKSEREASQSRNHGMSTAMPTPPPPAMNPMMGGFMPGMMPAMMGGPAMNPLMMSMMMGGGGMNPLMMGMNPMAGMGNNMGAMGPMASMGMGGPMGGGAGMGSMNSDISEADYLRVWQQYSAMNNQPFNANQYRQMYRQFKGH
ncbi:hypothetical protein WJX84_005291 [Apatococcus fuscideae]|uniref:YTH domain-containing protein n=1 Tax=Apatococcus fuscideae TaxID=2026836 RepID=A0AAW1ST48_9CHLO